MDIIYLKIKIKKSDIETNEIRDEGLFFSNIADALNIDREQIVEIDESNYQEEISFINKKWNDKS